MPVVAMPDGVNVSFPDEMPREQIAALIAQKFPKEAKAATEAKQEGFTSKVAGEWNDRSNTEGKIVLPVIGAPSVMGMVQGVGNFVKSTIEGFKGPGMAARGEFSPQPETPGVLTEEDAARANHAKDEEARLAKQMAGGVMAGAMPLGWAGIPRGSFGMGMARPPLPGGTPVPTPMGAAPPAGGWPGGKVPSWAQAAPSPSQTPPVTPPITPPAGVAAQAPEVVEAANRIGVSVPRYLVDDRRMTQGMAAGLQNIPGAGDKIARAAERTVTELGAAADTVKAGYGTGSPAVAGSYAKDALADWITTGSKEVANKVYDKVDSLVKPDLTTELLTTARTAQTILARRENSKIPGESGAVKTVMDAATTPGGLNYEGIKGLRSFLGEMTPQELISQGLKASEVKQLYNSMTSDLRMSVLRAGGAPALTAFNKANRVFENISERREIVSKIVGATGDAAPEAIFSRLMAMAGSKARADITRLIDARKVMGPEAWNEVASAAVSKLGRDAQGDFSVTRFLGPNGYSGLSDQGKTVLFRSTGRDSLAKSLDDIAFVSSQIEDKLKKFYNPSGTAKSLVSTGLVLGVLHSPIKTLSTIIGGSKMAAVLSEPATARSAADWAQAYHMSLVAPHVASRSRAVREAAENLAGLISKGDPSIDKNALVSQMMAGQVMGGGGPGATTTAP